MNAPWVIEFAIEEDGRWTADITKIPGIMAYGLTKAEAESKVKALARDAIAKRDPER